MDYNWNAISAIATMLAVIVAVIGYFITWNISKKDREQQAKQFQEEFRPLLTIKQKNISNGKVTFSINNVGNRAAKDISIEFKAEVMKDFDNKSLYASGKSQIVLENDRHLQPTSSIDYVWENDSLIKHGTKIDITLEYRSLSDIKYTDTIWVELKRTFDM